MTRIGDRKERRKLMLGKDTQPVWSQFSGFLALFIRFSLTTAVCTWLFIGKMLGQSPLAPNQTNGFGNGRLVTFTYLQNFDCVDQPTMDLDFNHVKAQSDPNEMQTPICTPV